MTPLDASIATLRQARGNGPADTGALLLGAVLAYRAEHPDASEADVARLCGIAPGNFHKQIRSPRARAETIEAVCRVLGLRLTLERAEP